AAAAAAATAATNANKEETTTYKEEKRGGLGWLWWLLGLLLLALLLFWLLKGCDGCNTPTATPPPVAPVDTTETISEAPVEEPEPYGADCEALGLSGSGSLCDMANYLSAAGSTFPNTFGMSGVSFAKNSDRLNGDARKYLDDMVTLLNQYPDATVDIYGYIDDTERSGFGGNKELTLDDVRARNIHDYLIRKGIDASRMNFSGEGSNDTRQPDLIIRGR
ncbi:MAG: OmpA family protein, partial [Bacteroidota bacterium]